jgi:hypothetical protein
MSRFAIVTPAWQVHAEVTLFDGTPGSEQPLREVARGAIMLDGGTAVVSAPPREVTAQLCRIYSGAEPDEDDSRYDSQPAVWVWLELDELALAPGPARAHVELAGEATRDIDVPAAGWRHQAAALRLPLWIDDQLRGKRDHRSDATETERFTVSVANTGDVAREVWIEEMCPARHRTVCRVAERADRPQRPPAHEDHGARRQDRTRRVRDRLRAVAGRCRSPLPTRWPCCRSSAGVTA